MIATICKIAFAILIGLYLNKKNIINEDVNQKLSYFVLNVCNPLLILTSMNSDWEGEKTEIFEFVLVGVAVYLTAPLVGKLFNVVFRVDKEERPIYELFFVFSNAGFMGYPVAISLYGDSSVLYVSMFIISFNLMFYTYGVRKINHGTKFSREETLKMIVSTGTVASLAAIVMFFAGVRLPEVVFESFHFIGSMTSPLSLIVIGASIGSYPVKEVLTGNKKLYIMAVFRMIIIPFAVYRLMTALGFTGVLRGVATLTMGMPVASAVGMGCIRYNSYLKIGPPAMILTTVLSLGIIPFLLMILG